jgi:uncharacterized protein YdeI (YjbR/CyaY-like superfamily)
MTPVPRPPLPTRLFKTPAAWEDWLAAHGGSSPGLWLKLGKGSTAKKTVSYQAALEVALCHGWIDGQKKGLDDAYWLQKFTPRGPRSIWSRQNRDRVQKLISAGRMRPAGRAAIERSKTNGMWDAAYDSQSTASPPEDFLLQLRKSRAAESFFATLDSVNRYAVLFRIQTAKLASTRKSRIEKYVRMLENGEKIHP